MNGLRIAPALLAALLSGCLTRTTGPGDATGAVIGTVLAGPTCPVETTDPTDCPPAAVSGTVQFIADDEVVGEVSIRVDGTFSVDVPLGSYTVHVVPVGGGGFPVCEDVPVTVSADVSTPLSLLCDTGIR